AVDDALHNCLSRRSNLSRRNRSRAAAAIPLSRIAPPTTPTTHRVVESTVIRCSSKFHREESMRAYQLPKGGGGIDALVKVHRPDPKPAYRQVVVKVKACSLNFRDLGIVRGTYRMPVRENLIPLSDGAVELIQVSARA